MGKGYVHVLTGNGKGKTTAAIGLAVRAAGAGYKIFFGQFVKKGEYSEIIALRRFSDVITVEQFGLGRFTEKSPAVKISRQPATASRGSSRSWHREHTTC